MRVVSGFLKGKKISYLKNINTRPLKDSVKENIFNILKHSKSSYSNIEKAKVLDLYSGVGSFGIECISRGAEKVTFIEKDFEASSILKENLTKLSVLNKSNIVNDKIENFLNKDLEETFNIIFLDPPFKDRKFVDNLKIINNRRFFNKEHIIIIHRERKTQDNLKDFMKLINIKEYGRSKIIFGYFN